MPEPDTTEPPAQAPRPTASVPSTRPDPGPVPGALQHASLTEYLTRLASRAPAPGGGAAAAVHAAQGAALLAMVARYSTGAKYAEHSGLIARVTGDADELAARALRLVDADATAFTAVTDAYRLPRATPREKAARSAAIADALTGAAGPPAEVIAVAERALGLADELLPVGNRNVLTDVAAAAEAVRAAATTARINVEINLGGVHDAVERERLSTAIARVDALTARADRVTAAVRREIAQ